MGVQRETVVLVHGLYVHGLWMRLLEYWLEEAGYHTVNYSYPSITRSPAENADDLHALLKPLDTPVVHFLGHSMGGLVAAQFVAQRLKLARELTFDPLGLPFANGRHGLSHPEKRGQAETDLQHETRDKRDREKGDDAQ